MQDVLIHLERLLLMCRVAKSLVIMKNTPQYYVMFKLICSRLDENILFNVISG